MTGAVLIHELLERSAALHGEREAVVETRARHCYRAVTGAARAVAERLVEAGIAPGDRVAILCGNSLAYVAAYYGISAAGAVSVPLNTAVDAGLLQHFLRDSGARGLIADAPGERLLRRAADGLPRLRLVISPGAARLPDAIAALRMPLPTGEPGATLAVRPVEPGALASIIYTSGSTGTPRGAALTHKNLTSNTAAIVASLSLAADDRALQILPFYYVYGKSVLNTHVAVGAAVVIENRFRYPATALDTLEAEACTGLAGVPSTFSILLDRSNLAARALPSLRYVTQAGGAMSPAVTRRLIAALPGRRVYVMYGATEAAARLAVLPPEELADNLDAIGRPIDGVSLRILRPDGSECVPGEVGELVASGPSIMRGYWNDPEETARVLDDAGYHTGDLARRDERGLFYVVGRLREMIKSGGHRIAPREIEDALAEHPAVRECAVVGVPDALLGQAVVAFVAPADGAALDPAALGGFLKDRLPAYKIPGRFVALDELPKNEAGKVIKARLPPPG